MAVTSNVGAIAIDIGTIALQTVAIAKQSSAVTFEVSDVAVDVGTQTCEVSDLAAKPREVANQVLADAPKMAIVSSDNRLSLRCKGEVALSAS
jgi:hypothetical protein